MPGDTIYCPRLSFNDNYLLEDKKFFDKIFEFDPYVSGHRLFFTKDNLPKFIRDYILPRKKEILSFDEFIKDYNKNRLYYILMENMKEGK